MTDAEWLACDNPDAMLDRLGRRVSGRKLRLFGCACYRHVSRLLADDRVRDAVEASERYADGLGGRPEMSRALNRAFVRLWWGGCCMAYPTPRCVRAARSTAAREAADGSAERRYQAALLRCLFGLVPPRRLRPVTPSWLAWGDGIVRRLAADAYEERAMPAGTLDNIRLAILADALEEAGCDNKDILQHLRQPGGVHVRGCWVVDLLLGRE